MELVKLIIATIALILDILSGILNLKAKGYIKKIENYKRQKLIQPDELISIIKQQNNLIYYENQSYDFYGSYHEKYTITIKENEKEDKALDVVYYLLKNADSKIQEYIINRLSLQRGIPTISAISTTSGNMISLSDLSLFQKWLKRTSGLDVKFKNISNTEYDNHSDSQEKIINKQEKEELYKQQNEEDEMAEYSYNLALLEVEEHQYENAKMLIEEALAFSNKQEYRDLLKDIDNKILGNDSFADEINTQYQGNNSKQKNINQDKKLSSKNKEINLESCSKADLLAIDGFDDIKADKFIKERNSGKLYYDIESFSADYGLQPHQVIEVQERLIFPLKPHIKQGRTIDM